MEPGVAGSHGATGRTLLLGVGASLAYLAFLAPGIYSIDGNSMLAVAESLVQRHSVAVPAGLGIIGSGGNFYSSWYPLLSFLALPFVAAGAVLAHWFHLPAHFVAAVCALILPALLTACTVALVAVLALQLGSTWRGAWLAAVSYAVGTIALVYARKFLTEPLLAFLTAAGLCLAFGDTRRRILGGSACAGLAVLAKPTGIILGPILSAYLLAKRRPAATSLLPLCGSLVGVGAYGAYNYFRFRSPIAFGQPYDFSIAAVWGGMAGLLASPGRGLIWYCPPIVLAVVGLRRAVKRWPQEAWAIAAVFFGYLIIYASWRFWGGGWSWGPRFLLPAIPGLAALLGLLEGRWAKALVVLTAVGFLVNAPTLVSFYERYYAEALESGISERALLWSPADAPLLHAWGAARRQTRDAKTQDVRAMFGERRGSAMTIESSRALRVVAVWWWVLPVAGVSRWVGGGVAFILLALGAVLVVLALRGIKPAGR